jgi:hypothetical protein
MNEKIYLFGRKKGNVTMMTAGTHRFNFEIQLPPGLPSSMMFDLDMFMEQAKLRKLTV